MAEKKEKQYVSDNARLMSEWDWDKNTNINPSQITLGSGLKVWWICESGHEWAAAVYTKSKGHGCPYCSGRLPITGQNDLQTINPSLSQEWNYAKNGNLKPDSITANSNRNVWWRCNSGHEWLARVASRNAGNGCPYCSGRYAVEDKNDLGTVNPALAKEWDYSKNIGLTPSDVLPNSNKKVWWKCTNGHEWQALINHRNKGVGCPYCAGLYPVKEKNDLQTTNPKLCVEWNQQKNKGLMPTDVLPYSNRRVWWTCQKGHEWQASISDRSQGKGCPVCNSERHTSFPEFAIIYYFKKMNIEALHSYKGHGYEIDVYIPTLKTAIEYDGYYWHKNKVLSDLNKNSNCRKDGIKLYRIREGLSKLNDSSIDFLLDKEQKNLSTVLKNIFMELIGKDADIDIERDFIEIENLREYTEKENSFLLHNPSISMEWNYEKNGKLHPEHVSANSSKKVWWICSKGHEWLATVYSRHSGSGCPYCSGKYIIKGENDLQTVNPTLAAEWNYEKNNNLCPYDVSPMSHKKVWWKCSKGHEWQSTINNRNRGNGCPYCSGRRILKGYNDLLSVNPELSQEWNYEKNGELKPDQFTAYSNKKVWWRCSCGYEWQSTINHRSKGRGCPECAKQKRKKKGN